MYEHFTDRARKVMALANQEANRMYHEYIGCEHILLGMVKEGSGVGATALANLGVSLPQVRIEVEKLVKNGPEMVCFGSLPKTPRAKRVITNAIECAKDLNHNHIGSEHLLLGLVNVEGSVALEALDRLGIKPENVREQVINLLGINKNLSIKIPPQTYLEKVQILATRGHEGQKRSNGSEYINHPISVMNRLVNCGIRNDLVLATALCHDLLEDTSISPEEIRLIAGKEVLEAVQQLTNIVPPGTSFEDKTNSMLHHAKSYGDIAKRVKLADRYDNLADAVWEWQPARVKRYAQAGLILLNEMMPLPDDVFDFQIEAKRFFECLS